MKQKLLLIGLGALIIGIVAGLLILLVRQESKMETGVRQKTIPQKIVVDRENLRVPDPNDKTREAGLAIPIAAQESVAGGASKIRTFEVILENNGFNINKIVVNENDVVRINLNAMDKSYDLALPALGISQQIPQGTSKKVEFQAVSQGSYIFSCKSCLATDGRSKFENNPAEGVLLVVPNI